MRTIILMLMLSVLAACSSSKTKNLREIPRATRIAMSTSGGSFQDVLENFYTIFSYCAVYATLQDAEGTKVVDIYNKPCAEAGSLSDIKVTVLVKGFELYSDEVSPSTPIGSVILNAGTYQLTDLCTGTTFSNFCQIDAKAPPPGPEGVFYGIKAR